MAARQLFFLLTQDLTAGYRFDIDSHTFVRVNTNLGVAVATDGLGDYASTNQAVGPDEAWTSVDDAATWALTGDSSGSGYEVRWAKDLGLLVAVDYAGDRTWHSTDGVIWSAVTGGPVTGATYFGFRDLIVIGDTIYTIALTASASDVRGTDLFCYQDGAFGWFDTLVSATNLTTGCYGPGTSDFVPRALATNHDLILATSIKAGEGSWANFVGPGLPTTAFTACSFSGVSTELRCAVAHPDGYWISGGDGSWGYSADGKAWVGVAGPPSMANWRLNDCLFDGQYFWFTASNGASLQITNLVAFLLWLLGFGRGADAAVFRYDPGGDYTAGTWTRYDPPGSAGAGGAALTGLPSWWDFRPVHAVPAALHLNPATVTHPPDGVRLHLVGHDPHLLVPPAPAALHLNPVDARIGNRATAVALHLNGGTARHPLQFPAGFDPALDGPDILAAELFPPTDPHEPVPLPQWRRRGPGVPYREPS